MINQLLRLLHCYSEKNIILRDKMDKDKWEKDKQEKVCFFDLDGILNYYPQTWIDFVNQNREEPIFDDLFVMKNTIPFQEYKDLKESYRTSGHKETLSVRENASYVITELKERGYKVVIISSRPAHKYPQLIGQTVHWLDRHVPNYDEVLFEEKKFIPVLSKYLFLRFGVEDNRYYANLVARWGYKMYLLNTKYNHGEVHKNVIRFTDIKEILNEQ